MPKSLQTLLRCKISLGKIRIMPIASEQTGFCISPVKSGFQPMMKPVPLTGNSNRKQQERVILQVAGPAGSNNSFGRYYRTFCSRMTVREYFYFLKTQLLRTKY